MRYFAMIDGQRRGPFELEELPSAGVGPDTYVWCKTMDDWQQAREVADICRYFRQRLAGTLVPSGAASETASRDASRDAEDENADFDGIPLRFRRFVEQSGTVPGQPVPDRTDFSSEPKTHLLLAVLVTLLCFPITGFVAIYHSVMTRKLWEEAGRRTDNADEYRRMAHDQSRQTKMWIGITFFFGLIFYAFLGRFIF